MINVLKKNLIFAFLKFWNLITIVRIGKSKNIKKKMKIAIVKPYNYLDLYSKAHKNKLNTLLNSNYRIGPAGLFTNHDVSFYISNTYNDTKINDLSISLLKKKQKREYLLQKKNSRNIKKIDFNRYDIVISFEDTISENTTHRFRKTLWAKIYEDHKKSDYKKNLLNPKKNFDIILNQTLGFTPYSFFKKNHWIDFSYTFGNSSFLKKINIKKSYKIDVITEVHQTTKVKNAFINSEFKTVTLDETLSHISYLNLLSKGMFFVAIDCEKPRWGNSLIEAALCGNLIIGNKNHFWNSQLILNETNLNNIDEAIDLIYKLKKDKKMYDFLIKKQNKLLNYLNYERPLNQIKHFSKLCDRNLNIKSHL